MKNMKLKDLLKDAKVVLDAGTVKRYQLTDTGVFQWDYMDPKDTIFVVVGCYTSPFKLLNDLLKGAEK